jgi:hypothetical protein
MNFSVAGELSTAGNGLIWTVPQSTTRRIMTKAQIFAVLDKVVELAWKQEKSLDGEPIPQEQAFDFIEHYFRVAKTRIEKLEEFPKISRHPDHGLTRKQVTEHLQLE